MMKMMIVSIQVKRVNLKYRIALIQILVKKRKMRKQKMIKIQNLIKIKMIKNKMKII